MKLRFFGALAIVFSMMIFLLVACNEDKQLKVGIIIPIEHQALNDIVAGFKDTLPALIKQPIKFKVANAQGDLNIQRAIVQQMQHERYDLIVPIGTGPTQMTVNMIHKTPVLSLASIFTESDRKKLKDCNVAVVHDEIPAEKIVKFVQALDSNMKQVVLIHSASDKIFEEVKNTIDIAQEVGIKVRPVMVPSLNELYSAVNNLQDAQAILVLKDNLIVSGISTLALVAKKRNIPLITSDEGSVKGGATVGLGVTERQIGIVGAEMANKILQGEKACQLPMKEMSTLTVFVNEKALDATTLSMSTLMQVARDFHYQEQVVSGAGVN